MKKISLIIPVYNVEKYLENCINSCLKQDISINDYEIIIVNDGSPDDCWNIIQRYANQHSNIKTINKENGGLSSARNAGINVAEGELIWFIDSDDSIKENCLSRIIECFENSTVEMISINYNLRNENGGILEKKNRELKNGAIYNGLEMFEKGWIYPFSAVQFYVFRKNYLDNTGLSFKEGIYGEDWLFSILSFTKVDYCLYLDEDCYNYFIHSGSITQTGTSYKKGHDCVEICKELYKNRINVSNERKPIIDKAISQTIKSIYFHWIQNKTDVAKDIRSYALGNNFWLSSIVRSGMYKYILLYFLIKFNIRIKL